MRGGIAHYTALLYQKLQKRGHSVHVLSFKRQYPAFLFPGRTQQDEGEELIPVKSTPILDSINPFTWVRAFRWIRKTGCDLLIFKYWMPFFAPCYAVIAWLARRKGMTVLYICDNIIPHEKRPGNTLLNRIGLAFVDRFIVQSRSVRNDLLTFVPDAVYREVPHPVYEIFPPGLDKNAARERLGLDGDRIILYFGFFRHYKGLPTLIQAMDLLLKEAAVRLVICGEFYEGREEITGLIESLKVSHAITLADHFIPNEAVGLYFSAADVVVLPYYSATQSGIVQVAYHYDKPVIITRVGGLPEVVPDGKTGFVVDPRDPEALAAAILRFYREKREKSFVENVRAEKQKYSWDRMVEAIEALASMENTESRI